MNPPLFSIITVCFNSEKTIERTIKSIHSQSCKDYEYTIVDGASKDRTLSIVEKYIPTFEGKMRYISEPDTGIYNAMNKGIRLSRGKFIWLVNSDDWLEPNALEIAFNSIKAHANEETVYGGWMNFHYLDGRIQLMKTDEKRFLHFQKKYRMGLNHPATFVAKSVYEKIGLFDENLKLYADAEFFVRCYKGGVKINFIPQILSNMSDEGISNRVNSQFAVERKYILKKHSKNRFEYYCLCVYDLVFRKLIHMLGKRFLIKYREFING